MQLKLMPRLKRHFIVFVIYAVVLVTFRRFDLVIFTKIGDYVEKVQKTVFNSRLSDFEYNRAFYLNDKFRNNVSNVILMWSAPFSRVLPIGNMDNGCVRTYDRSAITVAKAVVFHFAETQNDPYWLPTHRKASQRWIWLCLEPPTLTKTIFHKTLTPLNGIFNLTMTYRMDSDVTVTYQNDFTRTNTSVEQMMQKKRSSALGIWPVSNCKSSFRNQLIEELQQYITIDVKGKCTGDYLCRGPCELTTVSSYKFVFTLENSRCKDYITEKFFKWGLKTEAVPVVLGPSRSSYEKYAPAKSFIHVNDFESVERLAKYLQHLDENDEEYAEFLKYKSTLYPDFDTLHPPAKPDAWNLLCNMIKNDTNNKNTVDHLDTWWYGSQYHAEKSDTIISVCEKDDGTSGKDYHAIFYFIYHFALFFLFIVTCFVVGGAKSGNVAR